jgi:DNA-binding transcriptional ArsR family regulator
VRRRLEIGDRGVIGPGRLEVSDPRRGAAAVLRGAAAEEAYPLDTVFGALSDPIRRGMLAQLAQGPCSVSELGKPFSVSAPAISKHLSVLERSGLIERWKVGRVHFCRLITSPLQQAGDWIAQHQAFWERQLDALENYLNRDEEGCREQSNKPTPRSISDATSAHRPRRSSARGHNRTC